MKIFSIILMCLVPLINCRSKKGELPFAPVNPNASKEARNLLAYLYNLKGNKILSGQHNYPKELNRSTDSVREITGKYPVVWGCDFEDKNNRQPMLQEAIRKHAQGCIITLMYHQGAPVDNIPKHLEHPVRYVMNTQEWQDLVTPGTRIHQNWLADIDSVAAGLKLLQDHKIPVLWRPYHEMNGSWFWWCDKKGEAGIKKLWKMMFDRFTHDHQLNHLIWVWNANAPRDWENDEAYDYAIYYPGHEYVDVLATDIYKADYKQSHHDQLLELGQGKLIALGECGILPTPEILAGMNQFVWFMDWANFIWEANKREDVQRLYHDPRVLTLDEYKNLVSKKK
ncbi:glycoside hydrolase family 26 protein [candidate division KSB1 bacterium]|nr:glycoside hydrolase family 26 protein [candidate division KSB1 bacterium]